MSVKIRLARRGRRKQPFYHIIVADARSPRDGKFIENIGSYNPMTRPATIELDREKAYEWLMKGAQPTETARSILRFKGVLYKKHLQRGVDKGALSQEDADKLFDSYVETKEARIANRVQKNKEERLAFHKKVSGSLKKQVAIEQGDDEALSDFQVTLTEEEDTVEELTQVEESAPVAAVKAAEKPAPVSTPEAEVVAQEVAAPVVEAVADTEVQAEETPEVKETDTEKE